MTPQLRVLVIGQDNHFAGMQGVRVDHVVTRKTYTPDAAPGNDNRNTHTCSALTACLRLLQNQYQLALLPAIDLTWPHNFSTKQKLQRAILRKIIHFPPAGFLARRLRPRSTHLAMIDRYDAPTIHEASAVFLNADSYWKVNPSATPAPTFGGKPVQFLPLWVFEPPSGWSTVKWKDRNIDVFCASSINAPARERGLQLLRNLAASHPQLRVCIAEKPLTPDEFHEHMSRSRIVLSTEGVGFHCFRHYQTMLHQAVPLVNHNDAVRTDLMDQVNCLRYHENQEDFNRVVLAALRDPSQLGIIANQARTFARQHHTPNAIAKKILTHASIPFNGAA